SIDFMNAFLDTDPIGVRLRLHLGPRVGGAVGLVQALRGYMRVNLRRRQIAVAQQLLHASNVRSVVQQVRGEAVPQRVRAGSRMARSGRPESLSSGDASNRAKSPAVRK